MSDTRSLGGRGRLASWVPSLAILAILEACPVPASAAPAAPTGDSTGSVFAEFNAICTELSEARDRLQQGGVDEELFGDMILALFLRADSLAARLAVPAGQEARPTGLRRGTTYLIDSLRENWEGATSRNGLSFAEADLALRAAVAWRSSEPEGVAAP